MSRLTSFLSSVFSRSLTPSDASTMTTPNAIDHTSPPSSPATEPASFFTYEAASSIFSEKRRMHLLREDGIFDGEATAWLSLVQSAHVFGGWSPRGTNAPADVSPFPNTKSLLHPGHYVPRGQEISAGDAKALAKGIRRALEELPSPGFSWPFRDGGCSRFFPINDPRLVPAENLTGSAVPLFEEIVAYDLNKGDGERIAEFLSRGACRLVWGRSDVMRKAQASDAREDKRRKLEAERERLVSAVAAGDMTSADAKPRLDVIRSELASLEALAEGRPA